MITPDGVLATHKQAETKMMESLQDSIDHQLCLEWEVGKTITFVLRAILSEKVVNALADMYRQNGWEVSTVSKDGVVEWTFQQAGS